MAQPSSLARLIDGLLEMAWLFVLIGVPVFFNVRDYRVFEPDKIVLLRNMVLVMAILFLIKAVYVAPFHLARWAGKIEGSPRQSILTDVKVGLRRRPIVIAALLFGVIYVVASFHSILPTVSFWGSYDRMEGAYTYLSYIAFFLILGGHIRTWRQIERLVTAIVLASVPVAMYSWLQHFNIDPLIWAANGQTTQRTPSTMGNPIFLAAYLLMTVPFTLHRLANRVLQLNKAGTLSTGTEQVWLSLGAVGYGAALGLQLGAIGFSGSRGPALGLLAALVTFGLAVAVKQRVRWLLRATSIVAVLLVIVFGATNTVLKSGGTPGAGWTRFLHLLPSESGSSEVRSLLWKSSIPLIKEHPVLGCGPEDLIFCWYPHYPAELRTVELANAAPDRSHDEEIDIILTTGIAGEIAYLGLLAVSIIVLLRLVRRARDLTSLTFASALMAVYIGHIAEGLTGIAFSASLSMLWMVMAMATALYRGGDSDATASYTVSSSAQSTDVVQISDRGSSALRSPEQTSQAHFGTSSRRVRDQRQRQMQSGKSARRGVARESAYAANGFLRQLGGTAIALYTVFVVATLAAILLALALAVSNIQLIQADADYRLAQNYEIAAGQGVGQPGQYQQALATYQAAIASYRDALNTVPAWIDPPPQDAYYLFLGKTLLEYADALRKDTSGSVSQQQIADVLQQALGVFHQAARANPLNPDHPRNIAKLYNFWGATLPTTVDIAKLNLADTYFAQASKLAPHNSDILDEWAVLDMSIGNADARQSHQRYAEALDHLMAARSLFPESGAVYRDLGTAYARYAQFARDAHRPAEALHYARLQERAWLTALKYASPQYQLIYPRLAELYYTTLHDPCQAGQNAVFALQSIRAGTLADPNGTFAPALQGIITSATQHGCHPLGQ